VTTHPDWFMPVLQKRFDQLDLLLRQNPFIQKHDSAANDYIHKLQETLNEEQRQWLNQWEDEWQGRIAIEKEAIYRHGFIDGIHVTVSQYDASIGTEV
jgi:hypothetical protein